MYSRRTDKIMTKFFACNLNYHASNHNRYNKSAHEDRAITHILPTPHPSEEEEFSTNRPSSPMRKGPSFYLPSNPNSNKFQDISVILVIRRIIVNFPPSSFRDFFQFEFLRKNLCLHLFSVL